MSPQSAVDDPIRTLALAIGFLAVAASALVAHTTPATGYELSLFTMTPTEVWVGLLVAMGIALAVAFVPPSSRDRRRGGRSIALVLGGLAMAVFVSLPIIRGYRFYGHHDALTHLGWARAISEGTIGPFDMYYPGIHTVTVLVNSTLEIPLSRSMLLVVFLSVLVFCLFVPLCVGTIVPDPQASTIAAFAAFLLLPITTISMFLEAHAMSQAVLFSAVLVYLFAKYVRADGNSLSVSAVGIALALASVATVVYHPQLAVHLIVVFLGICTIQFLARRLAAGGRIAEQTTMYGHTGFLIALFLLWSSNHGFFGGMVDHFLSSAVEFILEGRGGAGDTMAMQGASLSAIGGSLAEIFFKLFFAQLAFTLLAGGLALAVFFARNERWFDRIRAETTYFVVALAGLAPLFVIYFLAPGSTMHFRVFGLMMLFVTILGSIGVHVLADRVSGLGERSRWLPSGRPLLAVGFAVLLVLSLAAVFPSPYTYNASPHVSDQQVNGYETAFAGQDADVQFVGLRNGPNRYDDATGGNAERMRLYQDLPESSIEDGIADQYESDRYVVVTQVDYDREVIAYRGLRYTEAELESIPTQPGVDHVQSNGEFDLYYVHAEPDDEDSAGA